MIGKEVESIEKKSKFVAISVPLLSVGDAQTALEHIREVHARANHHCYAYRIGVGVPVERFSDDGEPSGTAGRPILDVIRHQKVDNVLVVVTRYFGGVLLGSGGLIRAYTDAAARSLDATPKLQCCLMTRLLVTCDYSMYGKLEHRLGQISLPMRNVSFQADVTFELVVPEEGVIDMRTNLSDWLNGDVLIEETDATYMGVAPDGSLVPDVWPSFDS